MSREAANLQKLPRPFFKNFFPWEMEEVAWKNSKDLIKEKVDSIIWDKGKQ